MHLRLAAFLLGVRRFGPKAVALDVTGGDGGTTSGFRLIGAGGELIGAVETPDRVPADGGVPSAL